MGALGAKAVELAFVEFGWGVASAHEFDVGTDLLVLIRDERLFDPGLVLGAQVKSGSSFFDEEESDGSGQVVGWWFRDTDRRHIDYWVGHSIPHLIILHDPTTQVSYWAHVAAEAVVSTGRGAKVLVPRANTLDHDHLDELLSIAAIARPTPAWEGSAWADTGTIPPGDLLRHALLVPRLVAPHRNDPTREIGTAQAVALVIEGRSDTIMRLAGRHAHVPTLVEAQTSPEWGWRLVAALNTRMHTGDVDQILPLIGSAATPAARAAATVAAVAALIEHAHVDDALGLLTEALGRDDYAPVDHAWLTLQHARVLVESGQADQARAAALRAHRIRLTHSGDITATAIAGSAALLLFLNANLGESNAQDAIAGMDTTAAWWRTQRIATGTTAAIDRQFARWNRHRSTIMFSAEDVPNNRLHTAAVMASHLGDHAAWTDIDSLNHKHALTRTTRTSDPEHIAERLRGLLLAGDHRALDAAARRLVLNGPADAVALAATDLPTRWTYTTSRCALILIQHGADRFTEQHATDTIHQFLDLLNDPTPLTSGNTPDYDLRRELLAALAGTIRAAPPATHTTIAELVTGMPAVTDQLDAKRCAEIIRRLPPTTWTTELLTQATDTAPQHERHLRRALLGIAAPTHEPARQALLTEIERHNSVAALAQLDDLRNLPTALAAQLITDLDRRVTELVIQARQGTHSAWGHDLGHALTILNLHHPDAAHWEPIHTLLADPHVSAKAKHQSLTALLHNVDLLDQDTRDQLERITTILLTTPAAPADRILTPPATIPTAALLLAHLSNDPTRTHALTTLLLTGSIEDRTHAAYLATRTDPATAAGILSTLAHDPDPEVRASAASGLIHLHHTAPDHTLIHHSLHACLDDPGTLVPLHLADALSEHTTNTPTTQQLLDDLSSHPSAHVRLTRDTTARRTIA